MIKAGFRQLGNNWIFVTKNFSIFFLVQSRMNFSREIFHKKKDFQLVNNSSVNEPFYQSSAARLSY